MSDPRVRVCDDRCVGCGECVMSCPAGAIDLLASTGTVWVDTSVCRACGLCERRCPYSALAVVGQVRNQHQVTVDSVRTVLTEGGPPSAVVTTDLALPGRKRHGAGSVPLYPDVAVLAADRRGVDVLLAVEVVTPRTRHVDLGVKRDRYRAHGIGEYWTVDDATGLTSVHWSNGMSWLEPLATVQFGAGRNLREGRLSAVSPLGSGNEP